MDLQLVALLAFYAACIFLTAWTAYRVARGLPVHWGWKLLSVPASMMAFGILTTVLGIALGWSGEQVLRSITRGGFTYMLLHSIAVFWGPKWVSPRKNDEAAPSSTPPQKTASSGITRVQITLFGEQKDAPTLEARARTIAARAREALPSVDVEVMLSDDLLTAEGGFPVIRSDAMRQEDHQAVEAILQPILRSAL